MDVNPNSPFFIFALRNATERAALAAAEWVGRGNKEMGDQAAVTAMREALNSLPICGTVVIGEGEKDEAPQLFNGETVGDPETAQIKCDIAVDPVEGTSYLASGLTNAMAVIAISPPGTMFDPKPAFYMEKFVAPPPARGQIEMEWPVARKIRALADILGKTPEQLTIFVLEKPRHRRLIAEIIETRARVALYPAGDVAGAVMAAMPNSGIDAVMGTGGTPEGIIAACAVKALGGEFRGRIDPQLPTEAAAVAKAGVDTKRWYHLDELIRAQGFFCATGITDGILVEGVRRLPDHDRVQTLMISGMTGERQVLTTYLPRK